MGMPVTTPITNETPRSSTKSEPRDRSRRSPGAKREGLQHEDQEREPHRELRKQIVIRDGEREMQPMEGERIHA